jgi:four helix bundle protein
MEKAHKQLKVWKESIELVRMVYELTSHLPVEEKYGLVSQMRRAAISVPSNLAEGAARQTDRDSLQFFIVARGSLSELDTQLEVIRALGLLKAEAYTPLVSKMETVDALLNGLIRFRRNRKSRSVKP